MDYIELDLDSAVATETAFKENSALDTPVFELGRDLQNVVGFKIIETNIPSSYFIVSDARDPVSGWLYNRIFFLFILSGVELGNIAVDIEANRSYTAQQLQAELQTKLNAAFVNPILYVGTITPTVSYNSNTGKFSIILTPSGVGNNAICRITFIDPKVGQMIGFIPITAQGNSRVDFNFDVGANYFPCNSPYLALTSGPNYVQINSLKLCNLLKNYVPEGPLGTVGQTNTAICQVPITTNFGGVNYWQNTQQDSFDTQNLFMLDRFDLFLTLGTSKVPLKLNGLSWQCKIRLFLDRNYTANSLQGNIEQNRIIKRIRPT